MKNNLANVMYVPTAIFFASAAWSLFTQADRSMFIAELQTGLLFLILASLLKK